MAQPRPHSEPLGAPKTFRLTHRADTRIKAAAAKLHWSEADTQRLLVDIGLEHLERIGYNIASAIVDLAQRTPPGKRKP